ncbi:MAG: hypothetical protein JWN86_4747 [Planctomycetota bacterium]|nr:hypothetical protein [Planctomycetota bacterium]
MSINPVFTRELVAVARKGRLHWNRSSFAGVLVAIVVGVFSVRYFESGRIISHTLINLVARHAFLVIVGFHGVLVFGAAGAAALGIAGEKDRRTLDFLLATRLSNSEIVLGKLAASLAACLGVIAAGLPVMLLMLLMGVDLRLIFLTYLALASGLFFVCSVGICISTCVSSAGAAVNTAVGAAMAWWTTPLLVATFLPRIGIHLPRWATTVNSWILAGSPFSLLMKVMPGIPLTSLTDAVVWWCGWQVLWGTVFVIVAIAQLRSWYRVDTGGDGRGPSRAFSGFARRSPRRPSVGDDPIFWRERYTARPRGVRRLFNGLVSLAILGTVVVCTSHFAREAFLEVWAHGYSSGPTTDQRPEFNLLVRYLTPGSVFSPPADQARVDFNILLRLLTAGILMFMAMIFPGIAAEEIMSERTRETWTGLITTPLTSGEILRSKMRVALWRSRSSLLLLFVLWTLGVAAGSIHPLGFVVSILILASMTWFLMTYGMLSAIRAKDVIPGSNPSLGLFMLLSWTAALPFLIPSRFSTVILGVLSLPFDVSLSLVSYREIRAASRYPAYPYLEWIGLHTGEGPLRVAMVCLLAIVGPALAGQRAWRYAFAHFDRLVGRPWRAVPDETRQVASQPLIAT